MTPEAVVLDTRCTPEHSLSAPQRDQASILLAILPEDPEDLVHLLSKLHVNRAAKYKSALVFLNLMPSSDTSSEEKQLWNGNPNDPNCIGSQFDNTNASTDLRNLIYLLAARGLVEIVDGLSAEPQVKSGLHKVNWKTLKVKRTELGDDVVELANSMADIAETTAPKNRLLVQTYFAAAKSSLRSDSNNHPSNRASRDRRKLPFDADMLDMGGFITTAGGIPITTTELRSLCATGTVTFSQVNGANHRVVRAWVNSSDFEIAPRLFEHPGAKRLLSSYGNARAFLPSDDLEDELGDFTEGESLSESPKKYSRQNIPSYSLVAQLGARTLNFAHTLFAVDTLMDLILDSHPNVDPSGVGALKNTLITNETFQNIISSYTTTESKPQSLLSAFEDIIRKHLGKIDLTEIDRKFQEWIVNLNGEMQGIIIYLDKLPDEANIKINEQLGCLEISMSAVKFDMEHFRGLQAYGKHAQALLATLR